MENIVDLIASDASASEISDSLKNALFAKAENKINDLRPSVASSMFDVSPEEESEEWL